MASIAQRPNGHKWVHFTGPDGSRKTVRLGKASMRDAQMVKSYVERMLPNVAMGVPFSRPARLAGVTCRVDACALVRGDVRRSFSWTSPD